ncbi:retrovirus-related Pol polyprotein from transposon RE1 [Hevea brasiliensis]|uniref:retrovirus-related Pol polyprotein from transposon RE1 n=1 Tax=Hevea brasiliensis TaxID=3981 RepID=UPI000B783417|nr:retrovirus-related Pol polyprotein from transposon RE1 [Hevea brasiliensis]
MDSSKVCTYCGKQRHTVDTCHKKHGFSPGYKFKNSGSYANQATVEDQSSGNTDNAPSQVNSPSIQRVPFTQEQIRQLLVLIQPYLTAIHTSKQVTTGNTLASSSPGNSLVLSCIFKSNLWILDIGATHHICFSLSSFTSCKKINPIFVKLSNGTELVANYSGTTHFTKDFLLHDVLYIPQFTFNLICVTKLASSLVCCLIFQNTHYFIQEMNTWRMIGIVEAKEGLYILLNPHITSTSSTTITVNKPHYPFSDIHTKPLGVAPFHAIMLKLGGVEFTTGYREWIVWLIDGYCVTYFSFVCYCLLSSSVLVQLA